MKNRNRFQAFALFLLLLISGVPAFGQGDRATITGVISDPSGAVLPGVRILATKVDSNTALQEPRTMRGST